MQGQDSIDKIVNEIFFMANYHRKRKGLIWQQVEQIARQAKDITRSV